MVISQHNKSAKPLWSRLSTELTVSKHRAQRRATSKAPWWDWRSRGDGLRAVRCSPSLRWRCSTGHGVALSPASCSHLSSSGGIKCCPSLRLWIIALQLWCALLGKDAHQACYQTSSSFCPTDFEACTCSLSENEVEVLRQYLNLAC